MRKGGRNKGFRRERRRDEPVEGCTVSCAWRHDVKPTQRSLWCVLTHFLLAAGWGVLEGCGFEVLLPKVGFCPQSVGNAHLGPTVFSKSISWGTARVGPNLQQLKSQSFRRLEWYFGSFPKCWRISGIQCLLILLFDLHSEGGEGPMATPEQKQKVLCEEQVLVGKVCADSISGLFWAQPRPEERPFPHWILTNPKVVLFRRGLKACSGSVCLSHWVEGGSWISLLFVQGMSAVTSSHTAQSSEQDGIGAHFSAWKPKPTEQHKSRSARRKPSLWEEPVCDFQLSFLL